MNKKSLRPADKSTPLPRLDYLPKAPFFFNYIGGGALKPQDRSSIYHDSAGVCQHCRKNKSQASFPPKIKPITQRITVA